MAMKALQILLLSALLLLPAPLAWADKGQPSPDAERVIVELEAVILDIMKRAAELGYEGRYEVVAPAVRKVFDIPFMARQTVGRHWKQFSEDQQSRWVKTFENYTISNFAHNFDGYDGEHFEVLGQKPASRGTVVVLTKLHRTGGADDVELNYRMRVQGEEWRVVDLYSGGKVSEVALRRSEYAPTLKDGGIEKLIEAVDLMTAKRAGS